MKITVLYIFIFLGGILGEITVNAQKPVLDLIPVQRLLSPPEIVPDTLGILRDLPDVRPEADSFHQPAPLKDQTDLDPEESRRTGTVFHSFFKKRDSVPRERPTHSSVIPLYIKYFHPFQIFFQITAQK